ncbi:MAG: hypothetical protein RR355_06110, partial [Oscillospiraceae bacterium]
MSTKFLRLIIYYIIMDTTLPLEQPQRFLWRKLSAELTEGGSKIDTRKTRAMGSVGERSRPFRKFNKS